MNEGVCLFVFDQSGTVLMALGFDVCDGVIDGVFGVSNPDKLLTLRSQKPPGPQTAL